MFAGLFTINLLFYTTNFVGCLFLLAQGQKVDKKKITRYTFLCQQFAWSDFSLFLLHEFASGSSRKVAYWTTILLDLPIQDEF